MISVQETDMCEANDITDLQRLENTINSTYKYACEVDVRLEKLLDKICEDTIGKEPLSCVDKIKPNNRIVTCEHGVSDIDNLLSHMNKTLTQLEQILN